MKTISTYNKATFNFNPFGGLSDDEMLNVLVPKFDIDYFIQKIQSDEEIIIELVGKKGRGKTLHLNCIHLLLDKYPIFHLDKKSTINQILQNNSEVIFIDSIHHFNIYERHKIFKQKKSIILTTHISRSWEYKLAAKPYELFKFKGINHDILNEIIENRIKLACKNSASKFKVDNMKITELINIYKDDYRGILNCLYDEFQSEYYG